MGPTTKLLRTQSDDRLVALAQLGNECAFEAIVERYRRPLLRAARRVLPEARAEDAVQQAFLAAWRALERGDEVRDLRPWLYRITQHTALNALRVKGYDHAELAESLRVNDLPQDELERRDVVRQTLSGLASLPGNQREALLQTAVQGRSQAEVAAAMGLTDGAVRQLVHRARHTLRAAATALTPFPMASWIASAAGRAPVAERVAEIVGASGGAAALIAKVGTVAVVAGGAVGGGVALENDAKPPKAEAAAVRSAEPTPEATPVATPVPSPVSGAPEGERRSEPRRPSPPRPPAAAERTRPREEIRREDRSGHGSGEVEERENRSGPDGGDDSRRHSGSGGGGSDDPSGRGSGDDDAVATTDDHSGPGDGTVDDSSGPGPGTETPEPIETVNPDSGSGSSGSGSSGSDDLLDDDHSGRD